MLSNRISINSSICWKALLLTDLFIKFCILDLKILRYDFIFDAKINEKNIWQPSNL